MYHEKIRWPLKTNRIRRGTMGTFGMVRANGTRPHHGWDLYAYPGLPCYAAYDGTIEFAGSKAGYGNTVDIKLDTLFNGHPIFARYAHLMTFAVREGQQVKKGQVIGFTGNSGNAASMRGTHQHLHFEFLKRYPPNTGANGLTDRYNPREIYSIVPTTATIHDNTTALWEPDDGRTIGQR